MITDRIRLPRRISSTRTDVPPELVEAACAAIVHKASTVSRNAVVGSACNPLARSSASSADPNETGETEGEVLAEVVMAQRVAAAPMAPNTLNGALTMLPKPGADATSV